MDAQAVKKASKEDPVLSKVLHYTTNGWPEEVPDALKQYSLELPNDDECLLLRMRVIIPKTLQAVILTELHNNHRGMARMKGLASANVWWANLDKDILPNLVSYVSR